MILGECRDVPIVANWLARPESAKGEVDDSFTLFADSGRATQRCNDSLRFVKGSYS
jgi:hypothetical protein